ncbi:LmeA family phospholipid-binding protein [Pedococcus sp. KACC 23699]|uniref:LmeA family phospholipid-binding protein n=1 Tax=Pedococcus sp. KACC 23699 TaxID=3149228 RepID=A0AAU7JPT3_9MICO
MRSFLAGVVTTLVALAVAAFVVVATLPVAPAPAAPSPSSSAPGAPKSVAKGETWLADVDLSSSSVLTSDGPLTDIHATGSGVRLTSGGLRAQRLDLAAVLPFATAARQIGDVDLYAAGNGRAGVRRTANILGRDVAIRATGTVRAVDGQLVIEPETVDLGGPGLVDTALSSVARRFVTIRHTVTGLPAGMRLTGVSVQQNGFRATLAGTDVILTQ